MPNARESTGRPTDRLRDGEWLRAQLAGGRTQESIAVEVGCSRSMVSYALERAGIERPQRHNGSTFEGRRNRRQWVDTDNLWPRVQDYAERHRVPGGRERGGSEVIRRAVLAFLAKEESK